MLRKSPFLHPTPSFHTRYATDYYNLTQFGTDVTNPSPLREGDSWN